MHDSIDKHNSSLLALQNIDLCQNNSLDLQFSMLQFSMLMDVSDLP